MERTIQLDVPPAQQVELAGPLALVIEQVPPDQGDQRFTLRVRALSAPQEPLISFDTATDLARLRDRTDGRLGSPVTAFGHRPKPTAATAVTEPHENSTRLTVLEGDGPTRFAKVFDTHDALDGTCCPSLQPGIDPRWLVLSQPTPDGRVINLLGAEDGQVLRRIAEEGPDEGGQPIALDPEAAGAG